MKLPNNEEAIIAERKIVNYLLNETHPTGKHKAAFFKRFGFELEKWSELKAALLQHAATHEVSSQLSTEEGIHYAVEGELKTPDGRNPHLRSIWAIDVGTETLVSLPPILRVKDERNVIHELEQVALTIDLPAFHLMAGDVGTVVDVTPNGKQFTLEFFNFDGETIAVIPVATSQVRRIGSREIAHARVIAE